MICGGLAAIPVAAQADSCTVTVTLAGGQVLTFNLNVPAGTPLSSISLPVTGKVVDLSESCASTPAPTQSDTTTVGTSSSVSTPSTASTTTTQTGTIPLPLSIGSQGVSTSALASTATGAAGKAKAGATKVVSKLTNANGTPTANNPSYSFALPGASAIGVPNFFIDDFQIPPFLLPIYQAAGIEYNVPWQVLAAINWIETDYGRDLSVSSAGAEGWMQFLPSTFKQWGVDATGTGYADPYNPTDAIFTAARYLQAAGASKNLAKAIFAYNHAGWYVNSVLLRAQLIGGMPSDLIGALTGLVEGHFPVAAKATYADDSVIKKAGKKVKGTNAAIPVESTAATGTNIFTAANAPVIAVNDGRIVKLGVSKKLGRFIVLQDEEGNTYTYSSLGSIPKLYPVPKPVSTSPTQLASELATAPTAANTGTSTTQIAPLQAASAGTQTSTTPLPTGIVKLDKAAKTAAKPSKLSLLTVKVTHAAKSAKPAAAAKTTTTQSSVAKERLFANPSLPASYAAGGQQQLASEGAEINNFQDYFADALHLGKDQYTLAPLRKGSIVVAGTILGRVAKAKPNDASHLYFQIQPAGEKTPYIDPKPVLDGWKLLEATAVYRADGLDAFASGKTATIGQILLESKSQLQEQVLNDPHVSIYTCGRRDVEAGSIDRRVLAAIEFLSASGLDPTVSGLKCDAGANGIDSAGETGASMDISAINNVPVAGHDSTGSTTDIAIRRLLTLQGAMSPAEIISGISYKGQANTLALPDHENRIQVTYSPEFGANKKLAKEVKSILKPNQWIQLIQHISQIPEPSVSTAVSSSAVKTGTQ